MPNPAILSHHKGDLRSRRITNEYKVTLAYLSGLIEHTLASPCWSIDDYPPMDGTSAEMAAADNSLADRLTEAMNFYDSPSKVTPETARDVLEGLVSGIRTHARMVTKYNTQMMAAGTRGPQRAARPSARSGPASRPSLAKRNIMSGTASQVSSKYSSPGVSMCLGSFASDDEGEQPATPTRSSAATTAAHTPASSTPAPPKTPARSVRMSGFADEDDDAPVSVASSDFRGSKPPPRTSKIDKSDIPALVCADSLCRAKGWTRGIATDINAAVQEKRVSSNMTKFADEIKKAGVSVEDDLGGLRRP
ncbi:hypothetical protein CGCF415_v015611 [Colletotrichum fructicola]|nr:hypothetical protein CGCF415_v015611 [Colletotrichum fructicola]KAF4921605.1 hypothetical protein CGCF245_v015557 [Colletotrichum fructicola]KAF5482937.1 hypothetical protein CGCF413_v015480 [Colletotrichum fructicola]